MSANEITTFLKSRGGLTISQKARLLNRAVIVFFVIYGFFTLLPFYILFVRTFVDTSKSTELHLWIPGSDDVNLDAQIGNLATFYNLDLMQFKKDMGIPVTTIISARDTLAEVADEFGIPEQHIKDYMAPYSIYNGWISILKSGEFFQAIGRTAVITLASLFFMNFLSVCTGYGLAGMKRKDQVLWYNLYLLRAVIPPMLVILPQFLVFQWLLGFVPNYDAPGTTRSVGQIVALVLLWARGGALPAMIMTAAIEAIPHELEEAAEVDGANPLEYFWYVLLPLLKVPMASLTVIFLPLIWNDFIHPYVYLDSANTTLLPLIQTFSGQYSSNFQVIYTGVFLSVLPLILIYIMFRKWFIHGALSGAIKG